MADNEHTPYPTGATLQERTEWYEQQCVEDLRHASKRLTWAIEAADDETRDRWVHSAEFWINAHKNDVQQTEWLRERLKRESARG